MQQLPELQLIRRKLAQACARGEVDPYTARMVWQDRRVHRAGKLRQGLARLSAWYSKLRDTRFIRNASTCAAATLLMHTCPPKVQGAGCALQKQPHRTACLVQAHARLGATGGHLLQRR